MLNFEESSRSGGKIGLMSGQPILFPKNIFTEGTVMGNPILPANFQDIPFLAQGCGPLGGTGPIVGRLDPWPGP